MPPSNRWHANGIRSTPDDQQLMKAVILARRLGNGWGRLPNHDGRTELRLHARGGCGA